MTASRHRQHRQGGYAEPGVSDDEFKDEWAARALHLRVTYERTLHRIDEYERAVER